MSTSTFANLAERYKRLAPDPDLHGSYFPADIYAGDSASATLRRSDTQEILEADAQVWRLSPLGVEILTKLDRAGLRGQRVDVDLRIGPERVVVQGVPVVSTRTEPGRAVLGIRLVEPIAAAKYSGTDRRKASRWMFGEQFAPVCVAANPGRFNDFVYMRVREVGSTGMRLATSLRNKFLVKGMRLKCMVSLPLVSQLSTEMTIQHVELDTDQEPPTLTLGTSFDRINASDLQAIGQYLVQFGQGVKLSDLREQGLVPRSIAAAVEFSFVRTVEEYQQVLDLRYIAYKQSGKIDSTLAPQDMGEIYDTRSRIIIGKYHGVVVASATLIFNDYHDRMEIEESVEWPDRLPRRHEMVEVIRNCTHPNYRGSDLLFAMFHFIAITVLQAKRKYVVIGCTRDLVRLYTRVGMYCVDIQYEHNKLGGGVHEVMLGNLPGMMSGARMNPIVWNAIWADAGAYLLESDVLQLTGIDSLRMRAYRMLRPLSLLMQRRMLRPRQAPTKTKSNQ